jgi:hypothetical protein
MDIRKDLTQDEHDLLLMMQGYAMSAAIQAGNTDLARRFLTLTNRLNSDNPNFVPYSSIEQLEKIILENVRLFAVPPPGRLQ